MPLSTRNDSVNQHNKPIFDELLGDADAWLGDARDMPVPACPEIATDTPRHISEPIFRVMEAIQ